MSRPRVEPSDVGFGRLFNNVRDAVVVADASTGRIVLWNESAAELFGHSVEDAIGMSLETLVPEELRARHRAGIAHYAETGTGPLIGARETVGLPALRKDGSRIDVELTLSALDESTGGERALVLAVIRDVSVRMRLDRELKEANSRLSEALAREREASRKLQEISDLKSESVAMVAHDLKSPLTNIAELTALLRSAWDRLDDSRRFEVLQRLEANVERQLQLIDDVLQVERLEAGHLEYRIEPFDLRLVAAELVDEINHGEGHERVLLQGAGELPLVKADQRRLRQVLVNLLSNARKFSPAEQAIAVVLGVAGPDFVRVEIADGGGGIAAADLPRLFRKFSRVGNKARGPRGTGLGLYICKRMVEDQGGEISVQSTVGQGTTFAFTVPTAS